MQNGLDMRWKALACLGVTVLGISGFGPCADSGEAVLVRHHFEGLGAILHRADLAPVKAILGLPESQRLRGEVDRKLSVHLPRWFGLDPGQATNHVGALLPWVRAALDNESYVEVLGAAGKVGSWALAVRMDEASAVEAGKGLRAALTRMLVGEAGEGSAAVDWDLAGTTSGRTPAVRFARVGGWAVLGSGKEAFDGVRERIGTAGSPIGAASNAVFRLDVDLAKLAPLLGWREEPVSPVSQWPAVRMAVEPRGGRLRTAAEMVFEKPLDLVLEPWVVPTGVLNDPMVGFTAMQGADHWLGRLELFKPYGVTEWPRQFFLWSVAGDPWNQYLAGPMASPTNLMAKLSLPLPMRMVTNMSWRGQVFGLRVTNQAMRVEFRGLPYLLPFLESIRDGDATLLYGGLFPQPPKAEPAPAGLLQQVMGRTNLVLYDWETTGRTVLWTNAPRTVGPRVSTNQVGRLTQFKQLAQYWALMMNTNATRVPLTPSGDIWVAGGDWIQAAQGRLGDTITEVSQTGPAELSAVRLSQLGFNALELSYLLRWIENPGFPGWSGAAVAPAGVKTVPVPQPPTGVVKP